MRDSTDLQRDTKDRTEQPREECINVNDNPNDKAVSNF